MGKISTVYMNNLLNVAFGMLPSSFPALMYLGLSSTEPTDTGTNITETTELDYARVEIANDSGTWDVASGRGIDNLVTFTFPTAATAWGTMTHFVIMDASTVGEMILWGALAAPITVGIGDIVTFDPGTITITAPGTAP